MKFFIAFIPLLFTLNAVAAEGTTYCPNASSYHYNKDSGFVEGPGAWRIYAGRTKIEILGFKRVEANSDFEITGCFYDMKIGELFLEFNTHSNYYYVAPYPQKQNWYPSPLGIYCSGDIPTNCTFREET